MREGPDSPARTYDVIVGSRGRITLPPEVRKHFGLQEGGQIHFTLSGDDSAEVAPAGVRTGSLTGRRRGRQDGGPPSDFAKEVELKDG